MTIAQIKKQETNNKLDYACYQLKRALQDKASVNFYLAKDKRINEAWKAFAKGGK